MPAQETVRASFFVPGRRRAVGGCLRGDLFMGWSVCGIVCGIVYGTDSLRLRNLFKDEVKAGTGEPDRETGKQGIGGGSPVGQSAAGLQAGCFRGGANGLFCVRRNIYGGFLAPCAITRYIYKSELKKQTDR